MLRNIFITDPISLHTWNRQGSTRMVLLGGQTGEVRAALDTALKQHNKNTLKDSKVLRQHFGGKWRHKLGLVRVGGADEDFPDLQISLDDLQKTQRTRTTTTNSTLQFNYSMQVFPEDKISEFKYKITAELEIPIFRQHLWCGTTALKYTLFNQNNVVLVDMQGVLQSTAGETVCEMPINMELYRNKDYLKVEAYDNFTLVGDLYLKSATTNYNLMDLEVFVKPHRTELVEIARNDKYQLQMLYYGFIIMYYPMMSLAVFTEYIENIDISPSYPQLHPGPDELAYINKQNTLLQGLYELYMDVNRVTRIDQNLQKSLTETKLKIVSAYKGKTINLRVLFDLFHLTEKVDAVQLFDVYEGRHIMLGKYLVGTKPSAEKLIPGVMYFRVIISVQPVQRLNLYLYPNGAYIIQSAWGEDQNYEFSDVNLLVDKHINPIIRHINTLATRVFFHQNTLLTPVEKSNVKFIDISISIFWKKALTTSEFRQLKSVLDQFTAAHLIEEKQIDRVTLSYYFKKGMYEYDPRRIEKSAPLDNYYSYLYNADVRQKWFMLFENTRIMTITHRFSDVKIEISGIKEDEYYIYIRFVVLLMSMFMRQRGTAPAVEETRVNIKHLNNLKEQDPHLYNFKKIYNSDVVYSKICQKPYQPQLLTQNQYDGLSRDKRDTTIKYWNFTTNTDAYYQCPNAKYPHVRFIVGKHPMGYCIPCCKITAPPVDVTDKQRKIYDKCITSHTYEKRDVEHSSSRYVMSYGKSIDIGRLSHLPETTLEPLFYESKIEDDVIGAAYYLYGVPQNHPQCKKVGLLYCYSHAMGVNIEQLVQTIVDKLPNMGNYALLLNGEIQQWFATSAVLAKTMKGVFIDGLTSTTGFTRWNELFRDIALYHLDIYTINFEDRDTVIQLKLPDYLDNIQDVQYPQHQHIVVLHNLSSDHWNPVYIIHKDIYFRVGIIDKKLYAFQSDVIQLIMGMITAKKSENARRITYDVMTRFIHSTAYKIDYLLLTRGNLCYGVHVNKLGYVPLHLSNFKYVPGMNISFSSSDVVPADAAELVRFTHKYNMWCAHESERGGFIRVDVSINRPILERVEPIYPLILPERWLVYNSRCVAFISDKLNYYVKPTTQVAALKLCKKPLQDILYNPHEINHILEKWNGEISTDKRTTTIDRVMYKKYMYQLLVLEFIQMFNGNRNLRLREQIKRVFMNTDFKTVNPSKKIEQLILSAGDSSQLQLDVLKLQMQISDHIATGHAKKSLMQLLDREYYNFDMTMVEQLKRLPREQIYRQLQKLATQIVHIGTPVTDFTFPNILHGCTNLGYCVKNKLVMQKPDLDRYLDILTDQIKNPFVEKYLFSPLFQNTIIDYFKFTRRDNEIVEIEFL